MNDVVKSGFDFLSFLFYTYIVMQIPAECFVDLGDHAAFKLGFLLLDCCRLVRLFPKLLGRTNSADAQIFHCPAIVSAFVFGFRWFKTSFFTLIVVTHRISTALLVEPLEKEAWLGAMFTLAGGP
ncbi:MAG: hypothetical protein H7A42_04370 [Chlamydiales bacterium]|nr:hypothetical protein [Chlamydiales bacterium]